MTVTRIWAKHAVKPHCLEGYLVSSDPDFEAKTADVIGLYLHPPQHGRVLRGRKNCDSGAGSQRPGVAPLAGASRTLWLVYVRHGTLSLYAALTAQTGEVLGKIPHTTPRSNSWPS